MQWGVFESLQDFAYDWLDAYGLFVLQDWGYWLAAVGVRATGYCGLGADLGYFWGGVAQNFIYCGLAVGGAFCSFLGR